MRLNTLPQEGNARTSKKMYSKKKNGKCVHLTIINSTSWNDEFTLTQSQLRDLKTEYQQQSVAMTLQVTFAKNQVDAVVSQPNEHGAASLLQYVEPLEERVPNFTFFLNFQTKKFLQLQFEYQLVNKRYEDILAKKSALDTLKQNVRVLKEQEEKSLQKYRALRKKWNEVTYHDRRVRMLLNEVQTVRAHFPRSTYIMQNAITFAGGIFDLFTWRFWKSIGETLYIAQRR